MYYDERENTLDYVGESNNNFIKFDSKEYNDYDHKENYKFVGNKIYDINNVNINNFREMNSHNILTSNEGFNKGNMFDSSYVPYRNHVYKVVVKGERDELLLKVQELTFALKDLGLYLDVFPNDEVVFNNFKKNAVMLEKVKNEYEKKYGPLCLERTKDYNNYIWVSNPWPWVNERGGANV